MIKGSLARRYARALMSLGQEQGVAERLGDELSRFARLAQEDPDLKLMLKTPVFPRDLREKVIAGIGQTLGFHETMARFLKLLNQKGRLLYLDGISQAFQELSDEAAGRTRASVTAAAPLTPAAEDRLKSVLAALTGKEVIMSVDVDDDIIGGVVTRIEGKLLDGSLRTQLKAVEEKLKATGTAGRE